MNQGERLPYLLDGMPMSFPALIAAAKREGYSSADGFYFVSEAAAVLRQNHHTVAENREEAAKP